LSIIETYYSMAGVGLAPIPRVASCGVAGLRPDKQVNDNLSEGPVRRLADGVAPR
jgi:hypothetical protein